MFLYRKYNRENVFVAEKICLNYDDALIRLDVKEDDKVFCIEDDGHEIRCGMDYVKDMLDFG